MGLLKKLGRIATGRHPETGERQKPLEHLKQLHSPSKTIVDARQDRKVAEAETAAAQQQAEIDRQLAALKAAYNQPAPTASLTAGLAPPGNEGFGGPPPKGGEPLIGKKEWVQLGIAVLAAVIAARAGG